MTSLVARRSIAIRPAASLWNQGHRTFASSGGYQFYSGAVRISGLELKPGVKQEYLEACSKALPALAGTKGYAPCGLGTIGSFNSSPGSPNHFRMSLWDSLESATDGAKSTAPVTREGSLGEYIDKTVQQYRSVVEADIVNFGKLEKKNGMQTVVLDCQEHQTEPGTARAAMRKSFAPDGMIQKFLELKGCPLYMLLTYPNDHCVQVWAMMKDMEAENVFLSEEYRNLVNELYTESGLMAAKAGRPATGRVIHPEAFIMTY